MWAYLDFHTCSLIYLIRQPKNLFEYWKGFFLKKNAESCKSCNLNYPVLLKVEYAWSFCALFLQQELDCVLIWFHMMENW